ncbi:MAG: helix-turn-helix protein [Acidimicrobiaceae bacterium]
MTQQELAEAVGVTQSAVSAWEADGAIPEPRVVFAVERALRLSPGQLSGALGYVPVDAMGVTHGVVESVEADPSLDEVGRRVLLAVYRELTTKPAPRRGRPRRSGR